MRSPQPELWSAEPHPTPQLYQQLTPQQRSTLIHQLAQLMLKLVQTPSTKTAPIEERKDHER